MDKQKLIEALKKLNESNSKEYRGAYYHEAIEDAIDLIKQWRDEPITADALQARQWEKSSMRNNGYYKNNANKEGGVSQIFVNLVNGVVTSTVVFFNDEDGTMIYPKVTTMKHLHALEEMFLS